MHEYNKIEVWKERDGTVTVVYNVGCNKKDAIKYINLSVAIMAIENWFIKNP